MTAYRAARSRALEHATAAGPAVEALERNLTCGLPHVEVRAAQVILQGAREAEATYFAAHALAALLEEIEAFKAHSDSPRMGARF